MYPPGMPADPLLVYLATAGQWVVSADTPAGLTWTWQPAKDLEGAIVDATARTLGNTLKIDATITIPYSASSFFPSPARGNGIALALMIPVFPLATRISSRKRRRLILLAMTLFAFLLMAQSCNAYGSISGSYNFPLPENGFACEIAPENPNLAEMPGSSGQTTIEFTVEDDEGNVESCSTSATVSGIGILKRNGFYTEESLEE